MSYAALSAAQWVVGKALAPVADGLLGAWAATNNFGPNVDALSTELLLVKATLEQASLKELGGRAMEMLLQKLRDSAHNAEDLLDELDYFRIHDELHNTDDAAGEHGKGYIRDLAFNARHTVKAVGKQVNCCPWQRAKHRQRSQGDSSSATDANQEVSGCMPKLIGKLLPCSSSPHPHVSADEEDHGNAQQTPKLDFNRVHFSQRMKDIVEKLQPVRKDVNEILQGCGARIALDIAQHRPTTTPQSAEPELYGRDRVMNSIIHDITEGQYCDKGLTVLPVVGPGGMGKTTLIQHIYHNQQVQNHFPVRIWICVSFNFNLDKVLQEIKRYTPVVEGEKESLRTEELIEQRLKSKRFLLVLDDIWKISNGDDWKKLLLTLGQTQEKGSMILVTTRFQAIAQMVKTTDHPKELNGLEPEEFRKLFLVFVFDDGKCPGNKLHFLDKIMEKLKGSPLAAKTVGRLLRTDPSTGHWRRVLNSKEWENDNNGIMSALKLSYDFLPFHLQRCFFYSALFPEDYRFRSRELISLWVGLDILTPCGQKPTFEGGLRILNDLVIHGFFREEETNGDPRYVMHDLLHELALKVASNDCLSLRLHNVGSVQIQPTTRHLSISIDDLGKYDAVSGEKLKSELEILKTRLNVEHLQTLMLFGKMDEGFVKIFGDFFEKANALRVLHFPSMLCRVESMLHNFSGLLHLRYLSLGTKERQMSLPVSISKFYHLRILDLVLWDGVRDLPEDMSNLAKLCHFYVPSDDQLHSDIDNVGKLKLLEELNVFQVNKKEEGFEPKQLEHLTKLRELGIYNLEKIHTEEEAAQVKLMERSHLRWLKLDWDNKRSSVEPNVEAVVLESLQPHGDLQVLCIGGHGGPSCPTWLGDEFAIEALQYLYLHRVSWDAFPSLGKACDLHELRLEDIARPKEFIIEECFCMLRKLELIGLESFEKWVLPAGHAYMFPFLQLVIIRNCPKLLGLPLSKQIVFPYWFPKLQEVEIWNCPEFSLVIPISWIESLRRVTIRCVKMLKWFEYSKLSDGVNLSITGKGDLHSLDQVLIFDKETCIENLTLESCPPLESKHLLMLTSLKTLCVEDSEFLVGPLGGQGDLDLQQTTSATSDMEDDEITEASDVVPRAGLTHLLDSLRELVLVDPRPPTLVLGGGWLQTFQTLQRLRIVHSPQNLCAFSFSHHLFPSSLQSLELTELKGMGTLEPLSNLSSLTRLELYNCGEDLKCRGLRSLLTSGGNLKVLRVLGSPRFLAGWDPNPRPVLEDVEGGEEQQALFVSSTLRELCTDDVPGLLGARTCRFLSSSLTKLELRGYGMACFSKEQEDALQLLSSLQQLDFSSFKHLQQLPAGLPNLTSLKTLSIYNCPAILSLPNDGLPKSLQVLDVGFCDSPRLREQCSGLEGTIPRMTPSYLRSIRSIQGQCLPHA